MDPGSLVIIGVLVVAIPVAVLMSGMILATVLGWILTDDGEKNAAEGADAEYIDLNV